MKNKIEELKLLLQSKGQEHLLNGFDSLEIEQQKELVREISTIDWTLLEDKPLERRGEVTPIAPMTLKEIKLRSAEFEEEGVRDRKSVV